MTHFLVPASLQQLREREIAIAENLYARLLRPGIFLHPAKGITLYIRQITTKGQLKDIFVSDRRNPEISYVYTAKAAYLVRDPLGTKLAMVDGMAQALSRSSQLLSTTSFEDLSYDISALIKTRAAPNRSIDQISTPKLLQMQQQISQETNLSRGHIALETHRRLQQPLLCLVTSLIGFATLLTAGFSRFGIGRHIFIAIFLLVVIKLTESAIVEPVRSNPELWVLIYAPSVLGLFLAAGCLAHVAFPLHWRLLPARLQ